MSALKLYLIIGKNSQVEEIITFRELDSLKQIWRERSEMDKTAIIHCGFMRPRIDQHIELPGKTSGKVLYSGAMKWALPEIYKSSVDTVTHIKLDDTITPCYLALNQWGYEIEDQEAEPILLYQIEEPEQEVNSILLLPIDDLNLSERTANSIKAEHIYYISELVQCTELTLLCFRNLGKISLREIKDVLTARGLTLGMKLDNLVSSESHGGQSTYLDSSAHIASINAPNINSILLYPVEDLNLTIRLRNCLRAKNIRCIGELVQFTEVELLRLPNLGKTSVQYIEDALTVHGLSLGTKLDGWTPPEAGWIPEDTINKTYLARLNSDISQLPLIRHLERTLAELDEVDRIILQGRLGYKGKILTLEEIGEKLCVTRERIRQRQKKYIDRIIAQEYWDDMIGIRIGQLLLDREEPLILELLDIEDEWFKGFEENYIYLANTIQLFSKNAVCVIKASGRNVVTRISQNEWDVLVRKLRTSLKQKAEEKLWRRGDIKQYLETSLSEYSSKELVPLLHEIFDEFLQYQDEGPQALLIAYGISAESAVTAVLAQAEGPLHFTEIANRASDLLGKEVDERRAHTALNRDNVWLFDRGTYGLIDHCPFPSSKRQSICRIVEHLLYQAPINKQWHSEEIIDQLTAQFPDILKDLDPYVLRMCIEHSPKITFLNRMVWARADSGMTVGDRIEMVDSFIQILEEVGEPLSGQELKQRLSEIRGVAENMQIYGNERLVAVGRNLWGLSEW